MEPMSQSNETTTPLNVSTEWDNGRLVLDVAGEIDLVTAPELEKSLTAAREEKPEAVIVDITQVTFMASAGLAVLVRGHHEAEDATRFRVVADSAATLRPMQLMGLDRELAVYPSREDAMAA